MINTSKLGTLLYLHTLDAHNYVLFKDNRKLEPYLCKLSTNNRIYLSKFSCRSNYMSVSLYIKYITPSVKYVIKMK